jgi:hypothetical protein
LYFNIRVYALSQTYIGFKVIEKSYKEKQKELNNKENKKFGFYYYKLKDKILKI